MGETPLIRCAHNGHLKCVEFLIEHGADVNALDLVISRELIREVSQNKSPLVLIQDMSRRWGLLLFPWGGENNKTQNW
jgi:ankyrin repeat protein